MIRQALSAEEKAALLVVWVHGRVLRRAGEKGLTVYGLAGSLSQVLGAEHEDYKALLDAEDMLEMCARRGWLLAQPGEHRTTTYRLSYEGASELREQAVALPALEPAVRAVMDAVADEGLVTVATAELVGGGEVEEWRLPRSGRACRPAAVLRAADRRLLVRVGPHLLSAEGLAAHAQALSRPTPTPPPSVTPKAEPHREARRG